MKINHCKVIAIFFLIVLLPLFYACGGGGGGDSSGSAVVVQNQSPAGIWKGTSYSSTTQKTYNLTGIVSKDNVTRFISDTNVQYNGLLSINGNNITSTMTGIAPLGYVFLDGNQVISLSVSGTASSKNKIDAIYNGGGEVGSISLTYDPSYDRESSFALTAGTWKITGGGVTYNLSANNSGVLTGSTSTGCTFTGNIIVIDSAYNCYDIRLNMVSCGILNGNYTGLATLGDNIIANDTLIIGASTSTASITLGMLRQ